MPKEREKGPFHVLSNFLDEETGLYYFGARYYDPRTSVWQSPDPILGKYLPSGNRERDQKLSGAGGVYTSFNISLYAYAHMNPVTYTDPILGPNNNWGALFDYGRGDTDQRMSIRTDPSQLFNIRDRVPTNGGYE